MAPAWFRRAASGWMIAVHAQPGAKKTEVQGLHGDALKIRLAAPPVEGRANEELVRFLAETLGVPKAAVRIERGESSRRKSVLVAAPGVDPQVLLGRAGG